MAEDTDTTPEDGADAGAPAPRRDPYAQFGNPLNDTWGTRSAPEPAVAAPQVYSAKKGRRSTHWLITLIVLAALAGLGWLARDQLTDAFDWAKDRVTDESSTSSTTTPGQAVDALAEQQTAAFESWLAANQAEVRLLGEGSLAASRDLVQFGKAATDPEGIDPETARSALTPARASAVARAQFLDGAPDSQIRRDFINVLLVGVDSIDHLDAAYEAGSPTELDRAGQRMIDAGEELERLCRQYADTAGDLC